MKKHGFFIYSLDFASRTIPLLRSGLLLSKGRTISYLKFYFSFLSLFLILA